MKAKKLVFGVILMLSWNVAVLASEYYRLGQDYRSLAMGNTGIAGAQGHTALFYNPAALANIQDWWVNVHVQAIVNETGREIYKKIRNDEIETSKSEDIAEVMEDYVGKQVYLNGQGGASLFSNMNKKGFTIGGNYMYEYMFHADIRNAALPEMEYTYRKDLIKQAGFSFPIGLGSWVIGFNYKVIEREEIIDKYDMEQVAEGEKFKIKLGDYAKKGTGQGYDIGFIYRHPTPYKIQYGVVYKREIDLGDATNIPEEVAVGLYTQHQFGAFGWAFALDFRDTTFKAGSDGDKSYARRVHVGTELGLIPTSDGTYFLYGRLGMNQGYATWGTEVRLVRSLAAGYTVYQEETGEWASQRGDKRWVYYVTLGWGF